MRINAPTCTMTQADLKNNEINVNVYTGTPGTKVTFELDNGPEVTMKRTLMKDPFFIQLVKKNPDKYKDWMKPSLCSHIWRAPLPEKLKPGIHRLKITAKDEQDNVFTDWHLFEISSDASTAQTP
jgi:hypothetical protein